MANKIDFLKRGLSDESKAYLDEVIQATKEAAEQAFQQVIENKEIDKYIARAKKEEWVNGPVETLCDDYWYTHIEKKIVEKIKQAPENTDGEIIRIPDLDNVLYGIYADVFISLMAKKGYDDTVLHSEMENKIIDISGEEIDESIDEMMDETE